MKRITSIVGSGAVLDFDYSYNGNHKPSTRYITDSIKDLKVERINREESDLINKVYKLVVEDMTSLYRKRGFRNEYTLNFEELYFIIESLESYTKTDIEYYDPYGRAPLSALLSLEKQLSSYSQIEYVRACGVIIKAIIDIIDEYNTHFCQNLDYEQWYRQFWQGNIECKFDIFTLNYDTTIEQSLGKYEDGFELIESNAEGISAFNPKRLLKNPDALSTVQHLHGCIYYSGCLPVECNKTHSYRDMFKTKSVQEASKLANGYYQEGKTQAREFYYNSPILVGMRKLDKMTFLPSSIYHANLVNKLVDNSGLLIVGYSFGDLYVNQLLQRRLLMNGTNHRMVIIDYFPPCVNSVESLYRYLYDENGRMLQFIMPFFKVRIEDFKIRGLVFTSYNAPIFSEDHKCMLLICGFKKAVELHSDIILDFLQEGAI